MADAPSDRHTGHPDASVSIVFAAACCEAFANEIGYVAREQQSLPTAIKALGEVLEEMEAAPVQAKFLLMRRLLGGIAFDKGANPYQDFALLIALRNELIHRKAESYDLDANMEPLTTISLLAKLRSKNILAEPDPGGSQIWSFFLSIETRAVATWAVETAKAIINDIADVAPRDFRVQLQARCAPILGMPTV